MPVRFNGKYDLIGMLLLIGGLPLIAMFAAVLMPLGIKSIIVVLLIIIAFLIWFVFRRKS